MHPWPAMLSTIDSYYEIIGLAKAQRARAEEMFLQSELPATAALLSLEAGKSVKILKPITFYIPQPLNPSSPDWRDMTLSISWDMYHEEPDGSVQRTGNITRWRVGDDIPNTLLEDLEQSIRDWTGLLKSR